MQCSMNDALIGMHAHYNDMKMGAIKWILTINPIKDNEYVNPGKVGWII